MLISDLNICPSNLLLLNFQGCFKLSNCSFVSVQQCKTCDFSFILGIKNDFNKLNRLFYFGSFLSFILILHRILTVTVYCVDYFRSSLDLLLGLLRRMHSLNYLENGTMLFIQIICHFYLKIFLHLFRLCCCLC